MMQKAARRVGKKADAVPRLFFTSAQRAKLDGHFRTIEGMNVGLALAALNIVCSFGDQAEVSPKVEAKWRRDFNAVSKHAGALIELLSGHEEARSLIFGRINIAALRKSLFALSAAAKANAQMYAPRQRRGRAPLEWRDHLVTLTYRLYPDGAAKKSVGSHFEQTIELLLGYVGREVDDVHSVVIDALKRAKKNYHQMDK